MRTLVEFIARIDIFLYVVFGIAAIFAMRNLLRSRREHAIAIYALEREAQQARARRAFRTLILLILVTVAVYLIVNIAYPNIAPAETATEEDSLVFVESEPTPTSILLLFPTITPTLGLGVAGDQPIDEGNGCEIIGSTITSPVPNEIVTGQVRVEGESNILNFGMYKFEVSGVGTNGAWVVVGTFNSPVTIGSLGTWDATSLMPGSYVLRLVTYRDDGTYLNPCEIPIIIGGVTNNPTPES